MHTDQYSCFETLGVAIKSFVFKAEKNTGLLYSVWILSSNLSRVLSQRHIKGASQAKVCKFKAALPVDKKVLRLQVSVQDPVGMAEGHSLNHLMEIRLTRATGEKSYAP